MCHAWTPVTRNSGDDVPDRRMPARAAGAGRPRDGQRPLRHIAPVVLTLLLHACAASAPVPVTTGLDSGVNEAPASREVSDDCGGFTLYSHPDETMAGPDDPATVFIEVIRNAATEADRQAERRTGTDGRDGTDDVGRSRAATAERLWRGLAEVTEVPPAGRTLWEVETELVRVTMRARRVQAGGYALDELAVGHVGDHCASD